MWHPDMPEEYRNQIVTGDARELAKAIPDESIDLVFTDPIYSNIDDYRWLAETASRVLKPGGDVLVYLAHSLGAALQLTGYDVDYDRLAQLCEVRSNTSSHLPYHEYYDSETWQLVRDRERLIIEKHGYD